MPHSAKGIHWHEHEFLAALETLAAEGIIDARGRRVTSARLERILAVASGAEPNFVGDFTDATFEDEARFTKARFTAVAKFSRATFEGAAEFSDATFECGADFDHATFERGANFTKALFADYADFEQAVFRGDADFSQASLKEAISLGPMLVHGELRFDRASFGRVEIQASAARLSFHRSHFHDATNVFVLWADVLLDGATFERPSVIAWLPDFEFPGEESPRVDRRTVGPPDNRANLPRIVSVRLASVENLRLADADLRACRFAGARNLDRLRTERCRFAGTPRTHRRGARPWSPAWRWTRRQALAEEHEWRAAQVRAKWSSRLASWRMRHVRLGRKEHAPQRQSLVTKRPRWMGWYQTECRSPSWLNDRRFLKLEQLAPREIAAIYRAIRKEREDSKDEPGAADFYYGEMEMRRHENTQWSSERALLTLYWLVSGYGLRASRALLSLAVCIFIFSVLFSLWGIHGGASLGHALIFSVQSTTSLFRAPMEDLSAGGKLLEVGLRLLGPLFFGLALLSLRGRVKR
jgi:uncharacterized protein YjbI with pentapeptide repeats